MGWLQQFIVVFLVGCSTGISDPQSGSGADDTASPGAASSVFVNPLCDLHNATWLTSLVELNRSALRSTLEVLESWALEVEQLDGPASIAAKVRSEAKILELKASQLAKFDPARLGVANDDAAGGNDVFAGVGSVPAADVDLHAFRQNPGPRVPARIWAAISSTFDTARDLGSLILQHGTESLLHRYLSSFSRALRQDLTGIAAAFRNGTLCLSNNTPPEVVAVAPFIASAVNLQLVAELHMTFQSFDLARDLFREAVTSRLHAPNLDTNAADANAFAAMMYTYGQLVSGVGIKGLDPPAGDVLDGKQHIFVALETYRATRNPRYAAILEELAGEHVARGLNATTLPIVVQYFTLALEYLSSPGVNMTGTANYNAILGQYYLATATLELEHHYHLLRTLRSGHKQGSSTSSPQRPWTNHVRLTRSGVQHAKIEAVKSLVHVQRRYFAAVRHFRIQNLSLMTPDYQFDTVNSFRMCFFEVCKQGSQIVKTLEVVAQLEEAKSEPAVRGVVPHELGMVSGRGGTVFEFDNTELFSNNGAVAAHPGLLGPVKEAVVHLVHAAATTAAEIEKISNEAIALLSHQPSAAPAPASAPALSSSSSSSRVDVLTTDKGTTPSALDRSSPLLTIQNQRIPVELRLQLLQQGFREQFVDNLHRFIVPTRNRLRSLQQSYPWITMQAKSDDDEDRDAAE